MSTMVRKGPSLSTLRKLTERACNDPQRMKARKTEAKIIEMMPARASVLTPGESGMSRQSNEYTKSPFEVFPIGKHNTGLPTLSIGGAGARFEVCANAGDERRTNAKDAFFISTSRSAYFTTVLPYCIRRQLALCLMLALRSSLQFSLLLIVIFYVLDWPVLAVAQREKPALPAGVSLFFVGSVLFKFAL
jgi:hypothetical protein